MNEKIRDKLSNIIEIPKEIESLKDLASYDLVFIKGIDVKTAATLENVLHTKTITDLAIKNITEEEYLMLKLLGINEFELNSWVFYSKLIFEGKVLEEDALICKTLIIGLDNAGKTAILKSIQKKIDMKSLTELAPTIGVNRQILKQYGMN